MKEYNKYGDLIYEGEYFNGQRNGKGKTYGDDGELEFEGEFLNGKKWNGKGIDEFEKYEYKICDGEEFKI